MNCDWSGCDNTAAVAFLTHCTNLKRFSVSGCKAVQIDDMSDHVVHHSALKWMDCSWVNAAGPEMISSVCLARAKAREALQLELVDYYGDTHFYDVANCCVAVNSKF